jgi:hypothetical protein
VPDQGATLVEETAARWRAQAAPVSGYAGERTRLDANAPVPATIGGAVRAACVAVLR